MGCLHCRVFFSGSLEATEEKFRNRESRPEDLQVIAELKDMVSEREALVKKLVVGGRRRAWAAVRGAPQGCSLGPLRFVKSPRR